MLSNALPTDTGTVRPCFCHCGKRTDAARCRIGPQRSNRASSGTGGFESENIPFRAADMIAKPNEKISATWRSNIFGIGPVVMRKAKRSRYEFCHECRCRFDFDKDVGAKKDARQAPMLFDGTWRHLGGKWEILC